MRVLSTLKELLMRLIPALISCYSAAMAKQKSDSRTLRFNQWTGYASSAVAGLMTIGDVFGFMKADWTCFILVAAVIGISIYNYRLRLKTSEPVQ